MRYIPCPEFLVVQRIQSINGPIRARGLWRLSNRRSTTVAARRRCRAHIDFFAFGLFATGPRARGRMGLFGGHTVLLVRFQLIPGEFAGSFVHLTRLSRSRMTLQSHCPYAIPVKLSRLAALYSACIRVAKERAKFEYLSDERPAVWHVCYDHCCARFSAVPIYPFGAEWVGKAQSLAQYCAEHSEKSQAEWKHEQDLSFDFEMRLEE